MPWVRLVVAATTPGQRQAVFGPDDGLDDAGRAGAAALAAHSLLLGRPDVVQAGPSLAARQTALALGHLPIIEPALADCDYGAWAGRPLAEVTRRESAAVRRWLTDPDAAPHGGENMTALIARVAGWLDGLIDDADAHRCAGARVLAVAPAAVVRAALLHALGLPPLAFRRVDVAPLAVVRLTRDQGGWRLHLTAPQ